MLKTLIYFPPEYRDPAHKIRENYIDAVEYINTHYDVQLDYEKQACEFSDTNLQCIKERCTFNTGI